MGMLILIDCSCVASRGLLLPIACGWLALNGESIVNRQSRSTLLLSISHELRTKAYWLVSENWSFPWRACMKRRDEKVRDPRRDAETFWAETRDAQVRDRDETETLVRLETVSRPRRRDRDHIPAFQASTPPARFHPWIHPSFPRFIGENDVPDHYNNWPIIKQNIMYK